MTEQEAGPAMTRCLYCRGIIARDVEGRWFSTDVTDDRPWFCPQRWDEVITEHVPELP